MTSDPSDYYEGLDVIRGFAAVGVLWFHLGERLSVNYMFPRGYLAVDLFFVLSGFVIAGAYGSGLKSGKISVGRFLFLRIIRLLPLIILGNLLAALIELGRPDVTNQYEHAGDLMIAFFKGIVLLPTFYPTTLERSPVLFPLNGPFWSLFFEFFANVVYALWQRANINTFLILPLVAISFITILFNASDLQKVGTIDSYFLAGFARVAWSFTLGAALYSFRSNAPRLSVLPSLALTFFIFVIPLPDSLIGKFNLASVILFLPIIVFCAANSILSRVEQGVGQFLSAASYPVYVLHYPIVRVISVIVASLGNSTVLKILLSSLSVVVVLYLGRCAGLYYDVPIRAALKRWLAQNYSRRR